MRRRSSRLATPGVQLYSAATALSMAALVVLVGCTVPGLVQPAIAVPPDDGDSCHVRRVTFYTAGQRAVSAEDSRRTLDTTAKLLNNPLVQRLAPVVSGRGGAVLSSVGPILNQLAQSANEDTTLIRQVSAAFDDLASCRRTEIAGLRRDVRARRVTRAAGRDTADGIKRSAVADQAVARDINAKLSARTQQFALAIQDLDTQLPRDAPQRTTSVQIQRTVQTNQRALIAQAATVEASTSDAGFTVSFVAPATALTKA